jgi:hypothetical protein
MGYWTDKELERFGYFELDGARSPGVLFELDLGDGTPLQWDSQNGFGLSGEFLRFTGLGLAEFTLRLKLVDDGDRTSMDAGAWRRATAPPPQGQTDRIRSIRHPILERARPAVTLVTLQASPFETPAEGGAVVVAYKFKAYRKPLPQVGKPAAPQNVVEGKVPNKYEQAVDAVLDLVVKEAGSEGGGGLLGGLFGGGG